MTSQQRRVIFAFKDQVITEEQENTAHLICVVIEPDDCMAVSSETFEFQDAPDAETTVIMFWTRGRMSDLTNGEIQLIKSAQKFGAKVIAITPNGRSFEVLQ